MATLAENDCEWCGEAPWRYRCSTCDPRKVKHVCVGCTSRWHSRGFSQEHVLEDRNGVKRPYLEWVEPIISGDVDLTSRCEPGAPYVGSSIVTVSLKDASEERTRDMVADLTTRATNQLCVNGDMAMESSLVDSHSAPKDTLPNQNENDDGGVPEEIPDDIPEQLSQDTQLDLEEVLSRLPTDDGSILDALADHVHDAIKVEDALLCCRYNKCLESSCQEILRHHNHAKGKELCSERSCQSIGVFHDHMQACKRNPCPFCIRIKQRRLLGKKRGLNHCISTQRVNRRQLEQPSTQNEDIALAGFITDLISTFERNKHAATEELEHLNRQVIENGLPTFNFPRFNWHIVQDPFIKAEPGIEDDIAPETQQTELSSGALDKHPQELSPSVPPPPADDSAAPDGWKSPDFIRDTMTKKNSGDEESKVLFEESLKSAFSIVDASFCSPAKASRCLLNCHKILVHLQHHVDLDVCKDNMCQIVEYHFSHASSCQNVGDDKSCEYCLRVTEREFSRVVELMEAELPETDAKIQSLIAGITESLSNDPRDEREQIVMQLEDELQEVEDYKKSLLDKISAASLNLRKVRRRMKRHAPSPPTSAMTGLPLHFIKTRNGSPSKRRKI